MLMKESCNGLLAGYDSGIHTTSLLKKNYWPNLKDEAQEYVKNCLM